MTKNAPRLEPNRQKLFTAEKFRLERDGPVAPIDAVPDRKSFYDQRATNRAAEVKRHYHRLLRNYFAFLIPPGQRVLELGCGIGDLLSSLKASRAVGVDFSAKTIELARSEHAEVEFHLADAAEFQTEEKFDYIVLSD